MPNEYGITAKEAAEAFNGVEFSDCNGMEHSALTPGEKRTYLFYCHPYSSYERGTNENTNKLIRRHIPKVEYFD